MAKTHHFPKKETAITQDDIAKIAREALDKVDKSKLIVDSLFMVKTATGTVHEVIMSPEHTNEILKRIGELTGGIRIVNEPIPFNWTREIPTIEEGKKPS